jgi:hypothetical protein
VVFPDDAWIGFDASSAGPDRSLPSLWVVAGGEQQSARGVRAGAVRRDDLGEGVGDAPAAGVEHSELLVEVGYATGQGPKRQSGDRH